MPSIKRHDGSSWSSAIAAGKIKYWDGSTWNPGLKIKRRNSSNTTWIEAYTGSDPKTFRIPTNLTKSFRSTSGGTSGTWITSNGFANGATALRSGKFGGRGAWSVRNYDSALGAHYIASCYWSSYAWAGVMNFSNTSTIYETTGGISPAATSSTLEDVLAERPVVSAAKLVLQRLNTASTAGQEGGEGFSTATGNINVARYNNSITASTPSLSYILGTHVVTKSDSISRGEIVEINLAADSVAEAQALVDHASTSEGGLCIYPYSTTATSGDGMRSPWNPGMSSNGCVVNTYISVPNALDPDPDSNYMFFFDSTTDGSDPSGFGTAPDNPYIEITVDYQ